MGGAVIDFR
jgi:hypothetical protein